MASVGASPSGRIGLVKGRAQRKDPDTGLYAKRDLTTGRFLPADRRGRAAVGVESSVDTTVEGSERPQG